MSDICNKPRIVARRHRRRTRPVRRQAAALQRRSGLQNAGVDFGRTDFAALAQVYGGNGITVSGPGEIGPALTKELVLTCRPFDAQEARAAGFLNRLVPEAELGSWILVHAGFAIQTLDEEEAQATFAVLRDLGIDPSGAEEVPRV